MGVAATLPELSEWTLRRRLTDLNCSDSTIVHKEKSSSCINLNLD